MELQDTEGKFETEEDNDKDSLALSELPVVEQSYSTNGSFDEWFSPSDPFSPCRDFDTNNSDPGGLILVSFSFLGSFLLFPGFSFGLFISSATVSNTSIAPPKLGVMMFVPDDADFLDSSAGYSKSCSNEGNE